MYARVRSFQRSSSHPIRNSQSCRSPKRYCRTHRFCIQLRIMRGDRLPGRSGHIPRGTRQYPSHHRRHRHRPISDVHRRDDPRGSRCLRRRCQRRSRDAVAPDRHDVPLCRSCRERLHLHGTLRRTTRRFSSINYLEIQYRFAIYLLIIYSFL